MSPNQPQLESGEMHFVYFLMQIFSIIHLTTASWLSSVFYYKYIGLGSYKDWETSHFWSLSVEEHFYLIWPFVFVYLKKYRVFFATLVIIITALFRVNEYYKFSQTPYLFDPNFIVFRADALMIGCLLAIFEKKVTALVTKSPRFLLNPITIFSLLIFFSSNILAQLNFKYGLHLGIAIIPLGIGSPIGLVSNLLIAILIITSVKVSGIWFQFLNLPIMNYFGKLSYSLYLWQELFLSDHVGVLQKIPFNLICIFLAANFSYYFIERPFLKFKTRFESKKVTVAAANIVPAL